MEKVLLINPCRTYPPNTRNPTLSLPLGLLYIAEVLEREGLPVSVFDALTNKKTRVKKFGDVVHHGVDDEDLCNEIIKENPSIVGLGTPFSVQIDNLIHAAKLVRKVLPSAFIVVGGPHFSVETKSFLDENSEIDCYVAGEGEQAMLDIVRARQKNSSIAEISGVTSRIKENDGTYTIKSNGNVFIEDLGWLRLPAYHKIDMDEFFHQQAKGLLSRPYKNGSVVSILTSRGCPFKCTFCSVHLSMGYDVRFHPIENVIDNIEYLVKNHNVKHFEFEDDNLTFNIKRTEKLFSELAKKDFKITWNTPNGVRFDLLTLPLLKQMKKAGCKSLVVAPESGDQETLNKIIKKRMKLEKIFNVGKWCQELSIELSAFYLIGFPGETKKKIQKTLDFALSLYKDYDVIPMLSIAMPLFGTELHEQTVRNGYNVVDINRQTLASGRNTGMIKTPEFDPDDLKKFRSWFNEQLDVIKAQKLSKKPVHTRVYSFLYQEAKKVPFMKKAGKFILGRAY